MILEVLGSGAGGGVPQWNCACPNCARVRAGDPRVRARTQDSVAAFVGGDAILLNASPDVLRQIEREPRLQPRRARHSPIRGVVLTNGDLDHVLGLFSLRESQPFTLWATGRVWEGLARNAFMKTLDRFEGHVTFASLRLGEPTRLSGDLVATAIPLRGKPPVHLEGTLAPSAEDNVALLLQEGATTALYASSCLDVRELEPHLGGVGTLLVDGTFFVEDELIRLGLGTAEARSMAHQPIAGDTGSLAVLARWPIPRRIYTHINNTNPILVEGSKEASSVLEAGLEIAHDGMEIHG